MYQVPFYKRPTFPEEAELMAAFRNGDNSFEDKCRQWWLERLQCPAYIFTKSCTQALELSVLSGNFAAGSEVILPAFAYVSLANAIYMQGLKCIFVDSLPGTMNIDPSAVESAITARTVAVMTLNYAGVACDYKTLKALCRQHQLLLIEDNAHGISCAKGNQPLGTFGDLATFSFDALKHINCYEGGGLAVNDSSHLSSLKSLSQMGTNREAFFKGNVPHYEWVGPGTNTRLAAILYPNLYAQLQQTEAVVSRLRQIWQRYFETLGELESAELLSLPQYHADDRHNGHTFWFKTATEAERITLQQHLDQAGIQSAFHYYPLQRSAFGRKVGEFRGEDRCASQDSLRLLRLPLFYDLTEEQQNLVVDVIFSFYRNR
jgi:dTDP-4-amino-4,6-dideoxygalactose transaminase